MLDEQVRRKAFLVLILLAVYAGVSFWVPFSKYWVMKDLMQTQSRMFHAFPSTDRVRDFLIGKAEALELRIRPEDVRVQNINGEVIYIEMTWDAPVDILFYHTNLNFNPKIFGLVRGFDNSGLASGSLDELTPLLSDSTNRFLENKNLLQSSIRRFFSR